MVSFLKEYLKLSLIDLDCVYLCGGKLEYI